jgi:FKBP-type peptidyl-prolyl cis-trans isomerase (trigger factor)
MLVLAEIARKDGLSVSEMELSEGFKGMAMSTGQEPEALRKYYEANHLIESFRQNLLEEKALNYLAKGATISEVEADKLSLDKPEET